MSVNALTIDEIARTSDADAVGARFDARNLAWMRILFLLSLPVLFGTGIAMLVSHSGLRATICVVNLFAAAVAWKFAPRWLRTRVAPVVIAYVAVQTALFVIYAARTEGLIAIATIVPILMGGFRMRACWLLTLHLFVAGVLIASAIFVPPPKPGDTIPALIASSIIINGILFAAELVLSRRMASEITADFSSRRGHAREQLRMRDELRYAREIQLSMLPDSAPELDWIDVAAISLPASEVGGDYYDYFVVDGRLAIVAGDVAGHGLASGIALAAIRSGFTLLRDSLVDPGAVLLRMHDMVSQTSRRRMLVACEVLLLDRTTHRATIAAAGHPPIIVRRSDGDVERFDLFALPLGVRLPLRVASTTTPFASGDVFVLHTDGAYEARNAAGESYGIERIEEIVRTADASSAAAVRDAIIADLTKFREDAPQDDDVTIVVVHIV